MNRTFWITLLICIVLAGATRGQVTLSTYFGGEGEDRLTGAGILRNGTLVVAGTVPVPKAERLTKLPGWEHAGDGILLAVVAKPNHTERLALAGFDGSISDLDIDEKDSVCVTGSFGSAVVDSKTGKPLWTSPVGGEGARIAAGTNGRAAVLSGQTVTVIGPAGKTVATWQVGAQHVNDIAWDVKNSILFATGFNNRRGTPPGQKSYPVQVAFVRAYDEQGKKVWTAYDWKGQEVADLHLMADTRGYRLAIGGDGKLYVAGESAGGNTMWSRQSQNLGANLPLARGDKYQVPYNTRANHITFVGRLDPKTGKTEAGTMLLARLSSGRANTIRPRALAADASGRVYVGGASASYPPVSANAFGDEFDGGGAFFCVFDRDFKRLYATKLCSGTTAAIALGEKSVAAVGYGNANLKTVNPFQAKPGGGKSDGWLVVFAEKP